MDNSIFWDLRSLVVNLLLYQVYEKDGAEFLDLSRAFTSIVTFPSGKKVPLQLLSQTANSVFNDVLIRHVDVASSLKVHVREALS